MKIPTSVADVVTGLDFDGNASGVRVMGMGEDLTMADSEAEMLAIALLRVAMANRNKGRRR